MAKFISAPLVIDADIRRHLNDNARTYQDWLITNSLGSAPIDLREWADGTATVYFDDTLTTRFKLFDFEIAALLELPVNPNTVETPVVGVNDSLVIASVVPDSLDPEVQVYFVARSSNNAIKLATDHWRTGSLVIEIVQTDVATLPPTGPGGGRYVSLQEVLNSLGLNDQAVRKMEDTSLVTSSIVAAEDLIDQTLSLIHI